MYLCCQAELKHVDGSACMCVHIKVLIHEYVLPCVFPRSDNGILFRFATDGVSR